MFRKLRKLSFALLVLSAVSLFAARVASAQRPASIHLSPSVVHAGGAVTVYGNVARGCLTNDQVVLLSDAFSAEREFAGVNAVYATVGSGGNYSATTRIPSNRNPGVYLVTGRCGGGNLGVSAQLRVTASPAPPPASGVSPAVISGVGILPTVFYTAADRSVWAADWFIRTAPVSNGRVLGRVSAIYIPGFNNPTGASATVIAFGTGTDHALWYATRVGTGAWSHWRSLGGNVSEPGAVYRGSPQLYSVYARGADGAVWGRDHRASAWGAWHKLGGLLYPNTGPAAVGYPNDGTYVLVVGLDKQLYLAHVGVTAFRPVGGRTTASPALTTAGDTLIAYARGTDNAAWYHRFLANPSGWQKMGGIYTSGLGASTDFHSAPVNYTVGLGLDSRVWMGQLNWSTYPPKLDWLMLFG